MAAGVLVADSSALVQAALDWPAVQPAVHWLSPRFRTSTANSEGTASRVLVGTRDASAYKVRMLQGALDWLAVQPAVHWLSPRFRTSTANWEGTAVTQAGQPAPASPQSLSADPAAHPIWAAGLTGAGLVVGGGDANISELLPCFLAVCQTPCICSAFARKFIVALSP